jgi:hypothetical protein
MDEGFEDRRAEGIMMFECGMQSDHRHVRRLESFENSLRLRNSARNRIGAQHLERREHDHPAAKRGQQQRPVRVEPSLHE